MLGLMTAIATTFDDNLYLTLFFSKINSRFRPRHIVVGEFIGFTVLVSISLLGFLGGLMVSHAWIGLLGFLPIAIGVNHLLSRAGNDEEEKIQTGSTRPAPRKTRSQNTSLQTTLFDPQTYRVSAVTIANGGNNIAIYIPLFASCTLPRLGIILAVCYGAIALWCFLSYQLTSRPQLTIVMSRYVRKAFPFVLIWLGSSIVWENRSHELFYALALGW
nr:cadmium resistance transporter [Spirulina sp. CCNP1310]